MKDNGLLVQYFTANTTDSQDLWKKAAEDAAVLKKMGATAVWFPPATKGAQGKEDMGYAPYDLYDLGEFDQKGSVGTRYGTKDEYIAAIKAMKDQGINVYADIAVRQKLGADRIEKVTAVILLQKLAHHMCRHLNLFLTFPVHNISPITVHMLNSNFLLAVPATLQFISICSFALQHFSIL